MGDNIILSEIILGEEEELEIIKKILADTSFFNKTIDFKYIKNLLGYGLASVSTSSLTYFLYNFAINYNKPLPLNPIIGFPLTIFCILLPIAAFYSSVNFIALISEIIIVKIKKIKNNPQKIIKSPTKINELCFKWLKEYAIPKVEKGIEKRSKTMAQWDNLASKTKTLIENAKKHNMNDISVAAELALIELLEMAEDLNQQINNLQENRDALNEVMSEVEEFQSKVKIQQNLKSVIEEINSELNKAKKQIKEYKAENRILMTKFFQTASIALDNSSSMEILNPPKAEKLIEKIEADSKIKLKLLPQSQ